MKILMRTATVFLLLAIILVTQQRLFAHEWTARKIEGKLVAVDRKAKIVTIKRKDGRKLSLDFVFMTEANMAYIKKNGNTVDPNMKGIFVELKNRESTSRCRALLVGVNGYNEFDPLNFCKADIDALPQLGIKKEDIICLTTTSDFRTHPTAKRIKRSILTTLAGLDADDVVVIALSGHGVLLDYVDRPDESYFCPQDASLDDPQRTMVSIPWLFAQLDKCPARFKMLLVDACRNHVRVAPDTIAASQRTTHYFCKHDTALAFSKRVNHADPAGFVPYLLTGLDSIDANAAATSFLSHSYYATSRQILTDMRLLITKDAAPDKRMPPLVSKLELFGKHYWSFDKVEVTAKREAIFSHPSIDLQASRVRRNATHKTPDFHWNP